VKRGLSLFLAAAFLAACGSDDGDDGARTGTTTAAAEPAEPVRFKSDRIPFTFEYPQDFAAEKQPRARVLARVGVERGRRLNAIQVRRTARGELRPKRYLDEFKRDLEGTVRTVATREERIGGLDVGVLAVEDSDFTSSSYFFTGAGQTWQLECIADSEHRQVIEEACRTALASVEFAR
jgi:hypothetical protein